MTLTDFEINWDYKSSKFRSSLFTKVRKLYLRICEAQARSLNLNSSNKISKLDSFNLLPNKTFLSLKYSESTLMIWEIEIVGEYSITRLEVGKFFQSITISWWKFSTDAENDALKLLFEFRGQGSTYSQLSMIIFYRESLKLILSWTSFCWFWLWVFRLRKSYLDFMEEFRVNGNNFKKVWTIL